MTYTHIDIDDELLEQAAAILGTRQKKDTVEAALRATVARASVARATKDAGWERLKAFALAGGFDDAGNAAVEMAEHELAKARALRDSQVELLVQHAGFTRAEAEEHS